MPWVSPRSGTVPGIRRIDSGGARPVFLLRDAADRIRHRGSRPVRFARRRGTRAQADSSAGASPARCASEVHSRRRRSRTFCSWLAAGPGARCARLSRLTPAAQARTAPRSDVATDAVTEGQWADPRNNHPVPANPQHVQFGVRLAAALFCARQRRMFTYNVRESTPRKVCESVRDQTTSCDSAPGGGRSRTRAEAPARDDMRFVMSGQLIGQAYRVPPADVWTHHAKLIARGETRGSCRGVSRGGWWRGPYRITGE